MIFVLRKRVGFKIAPAGVGRWVEIDDDRALFQRSPQGEMDFFTGQRCGGGKIGGTVTRCEDSERG